MGVSTGTSLACPSVAPSRVKADRTVVGDLRGPAEGPLSTSTDPAPAPLAREQLAKVGL